MENGVLKWHVRWFDQFPVTTTQNPNLIDAKKDEVNWLSHNGKWMKFSVNNVWENLRNVKT